MGLVTIITIPLVRQILQIINMPQLIWYKTVKYQGEIQLLNVRHSSSNEPP